MITLQKAEASDLEKIIAIQRASFKAVYEKYHDQYDPYVEEVEQIRWKLVERPDCFYHFVLVDETIVGFLRLVIKDEEKRAWLGTATILPQYQGQGYGSAAMALLEKTYPKLTKWDLCTIAQEKLMVSFYEKCGYHSTHTEPEQEGMDMVYMTKKIE